VKTGKLTAVVAVRKGSQRVPNKNIRPFGSSNLLQMKLNVLKQVSGIDEIVVNSDCDHMLEIGKHNSCLTHKRDFTFASSHASNSDFHHHIAEVTDADHIFLAPVCSPFISPKTHDSAITQYMQGECDSLTSVDVIKNHLWMNNKPLNYDIENVPNSQDLPDVFRLNYGISIITRKSMLERKGLVGFDPEFFILDEVQSIDIDTLSDFDYAEHVYNSQGDVCNECVE
jgi:CMP-N,N'-diacetyllegionaminic acid synthase